MKTPTYLSPKEYLESFPEEKKKVLVETRKTILRNIPKGFVEVVNYNMLGYVVPHKLYPAGYHCNSELPLPFINLAMQKKYLALYHMALYADIKLLSWFTTEYPKHTDAQLEMGKSCIRFKKLDQIPLSLIAELVKKITVQEWIKIYEQAIKKEPRPKQK